MTTIVLPGHVAAIAPIEASPAGMEVTSAFRSSATTMSDVSEWMSAHGAPADWTGDAAEAADHAMTRVAADADAARAAFTRVAVACDRYVTRIVELIAVRDELDHRRQTTNSAIDALGARIASSTGDDVATLQTEADVLRRDVSRLVDKIARLEDEVTSVEDRLIAAFQAVDTLAEGSDEADRDTTDVAALRAELTSIGGDSGQINDWWRRLPPADREALKISDPDLIGNTNGIPTGDRDDANRTSLERDLDELQATKDAGEELSKEEQRLLDRAQAAQDALNIPATEGPPDSTTDVNLILYRPGAFGGDGAVAVAYGDPDTADNTAVIVPGITNDGTNIAGQGRDAYALQQQAILNGESTATIAWMGYDAPSWRPENALDVPGAGLDLGSVLNEEKAEAGGKHLADFVDGLRASDTIDVERGDNKSNLTVIGHSYGSTTAAHAAHDVGLDADALAIIGSPGAGGDADHVSDLDMPKGKVYVAAADNDFVTWLGNDGEVGMGRDPAQADFGAKVVESSPGHEFHVETVENGVVNHASYLNRDLNPEAFAALTDIVQGDEPKLVDGRSRDANDLAHDWARSEADFQSDRAVDAAHRQSSDAYDLGTGWIDDRIDDFSGLWR